VKADITDNIDFFSLDDATKQRIVNVTLPGLRRAQMQATGGLQVLNDETERLERLGTATFEYTIVRDTTAGTYSNLKFLFEKGTSDTMKLVFNAGASFYSSPDRTLNQQNTRDYATAFSWEGKAGRSPFSHDVADNSQHLLSDWMLPAANGEPARSRQEGRISPLPRERSKFPFYWCERATFRRLC
jgi:hypothetical protein